MTNYPKCARCERRLDPRVQRTEPVVCGVCLMEQRERERTHIPGLDGKALCGAKHAETFIAPEAHHPDCANLTDCPSCARWERYYLEVAESLSPFAFHQGVKDA